MTGTGRPDRRRRKHQKQETEQRRSARKSGETQAQNVQSQATEIIHSVASWGPSSHW